MWINTVIEIVILLRETMFINGILTNAEIWYNLTKEKIKELENLDLTLLRKVLRVPFSTHIQGKSKERFKKLVRIKADAYSLEKFCEKKEKH